MLQRLFGRRFAAGKAAVAPEGCVPEGNRVYAIGDIHGRLDLLMKLEGMVRRDLAGRPIDRPVLVYLGDYIDRGYESRGVIDHMLEPPPAGFERVCLKGNHEDFLLKFLADISVGPVWLANGGRETLMSYGVKLPIGLSLTEAGLEQVRADLKEQVPQAHLDFMAPLPMRHKEGDYLFVHAGIRPGVPVEAQNESDLLWIRDDFLRSAAAHGCIVVHGHTPTAEPVLRANRIGIDTGAFATGNLTCLVLEGDRQRFLTTRPPAPAGG